MKQQQQQQQPAPPCRAPSLHHGEIQHKEKQNRLSCCGPQPTRCRLASMSACSPALHELNIFGQALRLGRASTPPDRSVSVRAELNIPAFHMLALYNLRSLSSLIHADGFSLFTSAFSHSQLTPRQRPALSLAAPLLEEITASVGEPSARAGG